jgi:sugar phosphate isomerase/epimerase
MTEAPVFRPGVMISQTWPLACDSDGETLEALYQIISDGFFQAVQTVHVSSAAERHAMAVVLHQARIHYTYSLARLQNRQGLNLSSLNHTERLNSVKALIALLDDAREAGASSVCVVSGPRPLKEAERVVGLAALQDSVQRIAEAAMLPPQIELLIEPLDYFADKKHSLGTVREGLELCNSIRLQGQDLGLCVDTAHMLLNGERFIDLSADNCKQAEAAVGQPELLSQFVRELHLCNAVAEPHHPLFGDRHLRFGTPGSLCIADLATVLTDVIHLRGATTEPGLRVYCEVLNTSPSNQEAARELYLYARGILEYLAKTTGFMESSISIALNKGDL